MVTKGELKTSDGFVGVIIWRVPVNETLLSNVGTSPSENGLVEFARIASPDVIAIKFVANGLVMASQIPRESCGEREAQHAVDVLIQVLLSPHIIRPLHFFTKKPLRLKIVQHGHDACTMPIDVYVYATR